MDEVKLSLGDILALDRTRLAAERTLMGWIRTSFSMMTFGFTIFKILQELPEKAAVPILEQEEPRHLGIVLAAMGTLSLVIACVQHWLYTRRLRRGQPRAAFDLTLTVASLVACLGLMILGGLALRVGPFA